MNHSVFLTKLSRTVSHALRHEPWLYGLKLDIHGWVHLTDLLISLRLLKNEWRHLRENDIIQMISESDKNRFELRNGRIRALYGHSLPGQVFKMPVEPPSILFHGTSSKLIKQIKAEGLRPMRRQYVHLSTDQQTALQVAKCKHKEGMPVIITAFAIKAYRNGIKFYQGNENTWLTHYLEPDYLNFGTLAKY